MARLVQNLSMIRSDIRKRYGNKTIYWLGDTSHRRRKSDHNPDGAGNVYAIDVMSGVVTTWSKAVVKAVVGRWDISYVIHNRTIWSKAYGWRPRRYTGSDPHRNHVHISGVHSSAARNRKVHLSWSGAPKPTPAKPGAKPKPYVYPKSKPKYPGLLKQGSKGNAVRTLQRRLNIRGYTPKLKEDGQFGPATTRNVKAFQRFARLTSDGKVGPNTHNRLWDLPIKK